MARGGIGKGELCAYAVIAVWASALALSACQTTPAAVTLCPPVRAYSAAEQNALQQQLVPIPPGSPIELAMQDYLRLRDASRACAAATVKP